MEAKVNRREFLRVSAAGMVLAATGAMLSVTTSRLSAKELQTIQLLKPQPSRHVLLQLLEKRASSREFSPEPLPALVLSNLLWAAFGINRADLRRTAPSASNQQEIDIYLATADGLYLFDAKANALKPIMEDDIRALTGTQPFVKEVAVNLVYVADYSKMYSGLPEEQKMFYSAADTGFISENVYLYCAAEGLATVVRGLIDRQSLATAMKLRPEQKITLAQSVGYPRKRE
jgi:SagB-type dehydrogenase family enzyme